VAVVKKMDEMMMRVTVEREHQAASVADRESACQRDAHDMANTA
jgi:hypothetical protein